MGNLKKRIYIIIIVVGLLICGASYAASVAFHERAHNYADCGC